MKPSFKNQRGAAMVLELLLLALVIGAGVVVYMRSHRAQQSASSVTPPATASKIEANGTPDNAAAAIEKSASDETSSLTTEGQAESKELSATDSAASALGGSYNDSAY